MLGAIRNCRVARMVDELFDDVPDDPADDLPDERAARSDGAAGDVPPVTRSIELDAAVERVWDAVADPAQRAVWLDDDDAASRVLRIDEVDHGRSMAWTWWNPDDARGASRVEIELTELATGGTRVVVTEQPVMRGGAGLRAQASAGARVAGAAWARRLLGLELLFVAAGACVGAGVYVG